MSDTSSLEERLNVLEAQAEQLAGSDDLDTAWIIWCGVLVFCECMHVYHTATSKQNMIYLSKQQHLHVVTSSSSMTLCHGHTGLLFTPQRQSHKARKLQHISAVRASALLERKQDYMSGEKRRGRERERERGTCKREYSVHCWPPDAMSHTAVIHSSAFCIDHVKKPATAFVTQKTIFPTPMAVHTL